MVSFNNNDSGVPLQPYGKNDQPKKTPAVKGHIPHIPKRRR